MNAPERLGLQSRPEHSAMRFVRVAAVVAIAWGLIVAVFAAISLAGIALGYRWTP